MNPVIISNLFFAVSSLFIVLFINERNKNKSIKWNIASHVTMFVGNIFLGAVSGAFNNITSIIRSFFTKKGLWNFRFVFLFAIIQFIITCNIKEAWYGMLVIPAAILGSMSYVFLQFEEKELLYRAVKIASSSFYTSYYFLSKAYVAGIVEIILILICIKIVFRIQNEKRRR